MRLWTLLLLLMWGSVSYASISKIEDPGSVASPANIEASHEESSSKTSLHSLERNSNTPNVPSVDTEVKSKRSLASLARTNSLPFTFPGSYDKRNLAYLARARSGGMTRDKDSTGGDILSEVPSSDNFPQDKRHIGSVMRSLKEGKFQNENTKRYFASPFAPKHSQILRDNTFKRYYDSLHDDASNDRENELLAKRYLGSLMRNRGYGEVLKRYENYPPEDSSEDGWNEQLETADFEEQPETNDVSWPGNNDDDGDDTDFQKRYLASLLKSDSYARIPDKKYLGSILKSGSYSRMPDKRYIGSLLKSDSYSRFPGKRYLGSLLKSKSYSRMPSKKYVGSLLKSNSYSGMLGKRYLGSLLKSASYSRKPNKRYIGSLLKSGSNTMMLGKRYLGSLLKSDNFMGIPGKRYLGSLLKSNSYSRMLGKRYLGSLLKSNSFSKNLGKRNSLDYLEDLLKEDDEAGEEDDSSREKRHIGSLARNNEWPFARYRNEARFVRQTREFKDNEPFAYNGGNVDMDQDDVPSAEDTERDEPDDYFETPPKRFLGYLARKSWFPRNRFEGLYKRYSLGEEGFHPYFSSYTDEF